MTLDRTDLPATLTEGIVLGTSTTRRGRRPRLRRRGRDSSAMAATRRSRAGVLIGLVIFAFYSVAPIWWLVVASTKSRQQLYTTNGLWFADLNFIDNLVQLFTYQNGAYGRWLWNSLLYSGVSAVGLTIVSLAAGYGIAKYQFRGRGVLMGAIIGSFLIPGALMTIPSYLLYVRIGLYDTIWAMILPACFGAFSVYLAKVYAEGAVPNELIEAARVDGAGEYRIFAQISLRLMTTAGATIFLLHFVGSWNSFFAPMVFLRDANLWPVMLGLYSWLQKGVTPEADLTGMVIIGALIATLPMALLLVAMQRYWRSGLTLGSLK